MGRTLTFSSDLAAPPEEIWDRVTSPDGINAELGPVVVMRMPARWRGARIGELPLGSQLGRAWLLLFGIVPFECDFLRLTEVEPGRMFQERSTMLFARRWEHRRTVTPLPGGSRVTDELGVDGRVSLLTPVVARIADRLFRHRHRRLRRQVGRLGGGGR